MEDINSIVEACGFAKENKVILNDISFKRKIEKRLNDLDYRTKVEYHCSGIDEDELHEYKVYANEVKVLFENMKEGLTKICGSFLCDEKSEEDKFWDELLVEIEGKI